MLVMSGWLLWLGADTTVILQPEEKFDAAWVRRFALNFERKISKNAELRAKFESDPQK